MRYFADHCCYPWYCYNLDLASSGYDLGFHLDLDLLCLHFHYPAIHPTDLLDLGHVDLI